MQGSVNWYRAVRAAEAGAVGAFMVCAALYLALVVLALEAYPFGAGDPVVRAALISFTIAAAVAGGTISGRSLGAGWFRSVISALAAHIFASALAFGLLPRSQPFDGWGSYLAVEFAGAVAATTLLCASGLSWAGKALVVVIAVVLLLISLPYEAAGPGLIPALAGISCWVVLPALAGLFLDRS